MNGLFELFIDVLNGQTDYSILIGLIIGLTFQFLWICYTDYNQNQKNSHSPWGKRTNSIPTLLLKTIILFDKKLKWLIMIIHRKENADEEPHPPHSFHIYIK